ncbi:hypothetical protein GCM10025867_39440 [Frondihabitans sucicola]|uniref:Uncharacterized protein n=1 Tax=Frondihabitans sucicola TaxID=1268041 RepID=A0ABM8GTC5_9MICO|nr:hypothetical protein GCM10025867_39440 [Frondihabitans sucicola]
MINNNKTNDGNANANNVHVRGVNRFDLRTGRGAPDPEPETPTPRRARLKFSATLETDMLHSFVTDWDERPRRTGIRTP